MFLVPIFFWQTKLLVVKSPCFLLTGVKIRNTIKWTSGLDPYFKENYDKDRTLLWQYFGSSDGVYRIYPGIKAINLYKNKVALLFFRRYSINIVIYNKHPFNSRFKSG